MPINKNKKPIHQATKTAKIKTTTHYKSSQYTIEMRYKCHLQNNTVLNNPLNTFSNIQSWNTKDNENNFHADSTDISQFVLTYDNKQHFKDKTYS